MRVLHARQSSDDGRAQSARVRVDRLEDSARATRQKTEASGSRAALASTSGTPVAARVPSTRKVKSDVEFGMKGPVPGGIPTKDGFPPGYTSGLAPDIP